ncbi:hypothetical protein J2Z19_005901 [Ensifer adhaerens]|uniref:Uncharacterized protein n=1 Tax=Ensifer adhaerens TaxID=106592 RepID=A0ACC5T4Y0_ENSAD|nr:hypothetical protein [Ensifer adhaerens]MBP1876152.1 hypothetical protein [Ensifer adhaerens]
MAPFGPSSFDNRPGELARVLGSGCICSISAHPMFFLPIFGTTFFVYFFSTFSLSTLISRFNQAFERDAKLRISSSRTPSTAIVRLQISLASVDTPPKNGVPATIWMPNKFHLRDRWNVKIDKN